MYVRCAAAFRYYVRNEKHGLENAPYVDNSWKWAGGGFISNVHDLVRFGNAMLYSFQQKTEKRAAASSAANSKSAPPRATNEEKAETPSKDAQRPEVAVPASSAVVDVDPERKKFLDSITTRSCDYDLTSEEVAAEVVVYEPSPTCPVNRRDEAEIDQTQGGENSPRSAKKTVKRRTLLPGYLVGRQEIKALRRDWSKLINFQSSETVSQLWTPVARMAKDPDSPNDQMYGMGWQIMPRKHTSGFARNQVRELMGIKHSLCASTYAW